MYAKLFIILVLSIFLNTPIFSNEPKHKDLLVFPANGLVLRKMSNRKSESITTIPKGTILKVISIIKNSYETIDKFSGHWVKVIYHNQKGYIFTGYTVEVDKNFVYKDGYLASIQIALSKFKKQVNKYMHLSIKNLYIKEKFLVVTIYYSSKDPNNENADYESMLSYTAYSYLFREHKQKYNFLRGFEHFTQNVYMENFDNDNKIDILINSSSGITVYWRLYLQDKSKEANFNTPIEIDGIQLEILSIGKCEKLKLKQNFPQNKEAKIDSYYFDCKKNNFEKIINE